MRPNTGHSRILLPPLDEQRRIAAVLDAIDDAIERSEAVIAATEELRRSLLHELLSRGVPGWHSEWREVAGPGGRAGVLGGRPAGGGVRRSAVALGARNRSPDGPAAVMLTRIPVYGHDRLQRELITGYWHSEAIATDVTHRPSRRAASFAEVEASGPEVVGVDRTNKTVTGRSRVPLDLSTTAMLGFNESDDSERVTTAERFLAAWFWLRSDFNRPGSRNRERVAQCLNINLGLSIVHSVIFPVRLPPLAEQQEAISRRRSMAWTRRLRKSRMGTDVLRSVKASASEALLSGRVRTIPA